MTLSRRVRLGATHQLGARLFSSAVSFVVTAVVLARVLPEADYGVFNFYLTLFLLAMTLVDFGANRAAIRIVASGDEPREPVIRAAVWFKAIAGALAFVAIAAYVVTAESGVATRVLLVVAAAHALFHGYGGASVGFEVDVDFRVPARSVVVGYAIFLAGGLLLAAAGVEQAAPYLIAFGAGIAAQNVTLYLSARSSGHVAAPLDLDVVRRLAREALPLGVSAVSVSIYYYADTVMLRPLRGAEDVAEYSVAYRLMSFGLMVPVLLSQVLFPVFTRCDGRSRELLSRAVRRAAFYLALVGGVGAVLAFAAAPSLLSLVFGGDYARAAPSLRVLAVAMLVVYLTYPHTTALIAAGRAATFTRITVFSAFLNVALNAMFLPAYGPVGAAWTTLATEGIVLAASVASLWRHRRVTAFSTGLLAPAIVAASLMALLQFIGAEARPFWQSAAVASIVAVAAAWWSGALPFNLGVEEEELR